MTDNEKLVLFKARADITDATQNELIGQYIKDAEYFILGVTGQPSLPIGLEGAQIDIAVGAWGKRGAEGESSHSEGGVSVTYESLSPALQALLRAYTLARVVNVNATPETP
jgi:hypothetical protein